jgi:hypothetical protein
MAAPYASSYSLYTTVYSLYNRQSEFGSDVSPPSARVRAGQSVGQKLPPPIIDSTGRFASDTGRSALMVRTALRAPRAVIIHCLSNDGVGWKADVHRAEAGRKRSGCLGMNGAKQQSWSSVANWAMWTVSAGLICGYAVSTEGVISRDKPILTVLSKIDG